MDLQRNSTRIRYVQAGGRIADLLLELTRLFKRTTGFGTNSAAAVHSTICFV